MGSDSDGDSSERRAFRLLDNTHLMSRSLTDAQDAAMRYVETGYDHRREDTLTQLRELRDFIDEVLEWHDDPDD